MSFQKFKSVSIAAITALSGCSTTFEVQVPQSQFQDFAKCLANPQSTYKVKEPATPLITQVFGATIDDNLMRNAAGSDHEFITSSMLEGVTPPPSNSDADWLTLQSTLGGTPTELSAAADKAEAVFRHPVHQVILGIYNNLAGKQPTSISDLDANDVMSYVQQVRDVASIDGWSAYSARAAARITYFNSQVNAVRAKSLDDKPNQQLTQLQLQLQRAQQEFIASTYISAYVKAYFRNGEFAQLNWTAGNPILTLEQLAGITSGTDQANIQRILTALTPPQGSINSVVTDIDAIIQNDLNGTIGKVATAGLVTRGGDSLAMPVVTVSLVATNPKPLSITKVDGNTVLEDVVRVTFEAIFDSMNQIPAVSNATGVSLPPAIALKDFSKIEPATPGQGSVVMSQTSFNQIDSNGSEAAALTSSALANLIRGINVAALNNEAVANTLTSIAATTARKVSERVSWCYYSLPASEVSQDTQPKSTKSVSVNLTYGFLGL